MSIASAKGITTAKNNNNNDDTKERLLFGKTAILYGDNDESKYTTPMEINTRKYYLSLYKSVESQIRHNVMNAKDLEDKDKTEAFVKEVVDDFVEHCKKLYLDYEQHQRFILQVLYMKLIIVNNYRTT